MTELRVRYQGRVVGDNRRHDIRRGARNPVYPNPAYKAFKQGLWNEIRRGMGWCPPWPYPIQGPVSLEVRCWIHPSVDPANLLKPIQDALELAGAIVNDNQIQDSRAIRVGTSRGGLDSVLELVLKEL
jgi:Holliday junction resolvase RusA-like endonuclease